ncbi:CCR4-NOT transcription complex subunit 4 [Cocos nucifera]|nr:CCR4-NOT transcription complex subunit 4 [Cocos nucifera]
MGFDSMAKDAAVPTIAPRDAGKKKRTNRSAKLKQCKLDARREQWLNQVKNKDGKKSCMGTGPNASSLPHPPLPPSAKSNLETRARQEEEREEHNISDLDSPTQSPTSSISGNSSRKDCPSNSISSGSSTESTSRSVSDNEEEPDGRGEEHGVLDDWEAVADALSADNDNNHPNFDPVVSIAEPAASPGTQKEALWGPTTKPQPIQPTPRAWRPDDVFRPRSLPSISKQSSFPGSMERHYRAIQQGILALPSPCPICYEDLDPTDSSFLPCSCGFRLCLFCHKRILEADGRCPGCRKQYDATGVVMDVDSGGVPKSSIRLSRSCSMSSRF